MPLFAVMDKNTVNRIMRIDTDKDTDEKIVGIFQNQFKKFEDHHEAEVPFHAGYSPSYGECLYLENFVESTELLDAVKRSTAIPVWNPKTVPMENIKALFVGVDFPADHTKIALQTFNKGQILDVSKSLWLSNNVFTMSSSVGFNVDEKLVATIRRNKIKFKSLQKLRSVFDMDKYFSEATDDDLNNFCAHNSFKSDANFDIKLIADTVIRTKVTLINRSGILSNDINVLKKAARKVNFDLKTMNENGKEKILMPSTKRDVKKLLTFLDEDIFIAEISKIVYRSNSKRPY
ncbi:DUF4868 domain-containing protein [Serratia fonticola]|uniref:DUF4868 domain-containing protein n=1 Tax=Serratia fonticola TaxID=47917 RepID=UPI001AE69447|nr:DUF4868 domain-containing protein [Serratia fonticola]MBP1002366.1 DUF4868 domain-containing protein [Serratia fonticola]